MKIIPINFPNDIESQSRKRKGEIVVGIEKMSITYIQPDDMSSNEEQTITLTTECQCSVGADDALKETGFYINIQTGENEHWSVNDGEELKALVDDFYRRLNIGKEDIIIENENEQETQHQCG